MPHPTLQGGGATGALIRSHDWSRTPLGSIEHWPGPLTTTVATMLHSRHPMFLWWGPELIQLYNDAYVPSFGVGRHPGALGQRGRECWQEIWPIIGPQIEAVMTRGTPTWNENQRVPIVRNGTLEEVFWTYGYSPVFADDGSVGGTLVVCTETTARMVADRRMRLLRALADAIGQADDTRAVIEHVNLQLAAGGEDVAFARWYDAAAVPVSSAGLDPAQAAALDQAVRPHLRRAPVVLATADVVPGGVVLPGGAWPEPATRICIEPLRRFDQGVTGYLVAGLSPRLPFDDGYRELIAQIADAVSRGHQRIDAWQVRHAVEGERDNLLTQAPMATAVLVGPDHVFQLANPLYCQVVGRTQLIGMSYREAFPELIDSPLSGILDRVYRTGEPFVASEQLVPLDRRGDGVVEDCYFRFNLEAIRDQRGEVYGMMAIAADITEQVRGRQALERAQAERESLVRELTAASRSKDEFLAMLGHELRNPLAPIVTALELMTMRSGEVPAEVAMIARQVRHLTRLVDDLLDVSRITRGSVELHRERFEISVAVARAIETASPLLERARHRFTVDVPVEGLAIDADPVRIAQVLANLLTNAAKYTPTGGRLAIAAARQHDEVVVWVRDDGVGIAADTLPHVFELFSQVRQDLARSEGGLGLGLAIVKSLVEAHGGTVAAASRGRGHGAELTVRLPAADVSIPREPGPVAASPRAVDPACALRILVVDDNQDAAETLADALSVLGHVVVIAHDGPGALRAVREAAPAVALLDIGLPVMDGYQLAHLLRDDPALTGIRLIAITGYGLADDRIRSYAAGFDAHLVKPVSLGALTGLLQSLRRS